MEFFFELILELGGHIRYLIFKPFSKKKLSDYYDEGKSEKQSFFNSFAVMTIVVVIILLIKWLAY